MKYKYLSTIGLLSMLLSVPIMATEAKSIPVEETFTAENIQNTISYSNNQLYMISAANELKAVGVNIKGINSTPFITSKWHSIKESTTGTAIKNVVQVKSTKIGEGGVYFLDATGDLYALGQFGNVNYSFPVKIKDNVKAFSVAPYGTNKNAYPIITTKTGEVFCYINVSGSSTELRWEPYTTVGESFKKVVAVNQSTHVPFGFALSETGNLYTWNQSGFKKSLSGIIDVCPFDYYGGLIINTENTMYNYSTNGEIKPFKFIKDGKEIYDVATYKILSDGDSAVSGGQIRGYALTNHGWFEINSSMTATYVELDFEPVAYADNDNATIQIFIDIYGKAHVKGDNGWGQLGTEDTEDKNEYFEYRYDWMNENPILDRDTLCSFNLENNKVYKRTDSFNIEYSIISTSDISGFNLYYAPAITSSNKDTWIEIEKNIPISKLSPTVYESGYTDASGNTINGTKYTYKWDIPKLSLVGISIIVEPIYS